MAITTRCTRRVDICILRTTQTTENHIIKKHRHIYHKLKTTTVQTTAVPAPAHLNDENSHVFQSANIPALPDATVTVVRPEDVTNNKCIREGCQKFAIVSPEWEDEYCSNSCAVQHCKDVFAAFVNSSKRGQPVNGSTA